VLFGAVGDWKYDTLDRPLRPEQAILGLRKNLGLFANLRPAILLPGTGRRLDAEAGSGVGPGHPDRARTDRRHLLRPAARRARVPGRPFKGQREGFDTMRYAKAKSAASPTWRSRPRKSAASA
jgi:3-isopropylmalate dehydrogenase